MVPTSVIHRAVLGLGDGIRQERLAGEVGKEGLAGEAGALRVAVRNTPAFILRLMGTSYPVEPGLPHSLRGVDLPGINDALLARTPHSHPGKDHLGEDLPGGDTSGVDRCARDSSAYPPGCGGVNPQRVEALNPPPLFLPGEPAPDADKYSGGVTGICAGSAAYPGAGVLATLAAVRTTSSMVRWVGEDPLPIILRTPEVVTHPTVHSAGLVQAWVVGPGRGMDAAELSFLLSCPQPLIIDADSLTLLSGSEGLRSALCARGGGALLTPHAGELTRLWKAMLWGQDAELPGALGAQVLEISTMLGQDEGAWASALRAHPHVRVVAARTVAQQLGCVVLLKGRHTVLASAEAVEVWDVGSSWAATPGSGDVLSGILGALLAQCQDVWEAARAGIALHSRAAWLAAHTPDGPAPTSALPIAEAISRAYAQLLRSHVSERGAAGNPTRLMP